MVFTKKHGGGEDKVGLGGAGGHKGTQPAVRGFGGGWGGAWCLDNDPDINMNASVNKS